MTAGWEIVPLLGVLTAGTFAGLILGRKLRPMRRSESDEAGGPLASLAENQRMLQTLLANLPGLAYRCRNNREWSMEFISDGCLELTGYPAGDFLAGRVTWGGTIIHAGDRQMVWDHCQEGIRQGKPFRLQYRIIDRNGREKWVWEQGTGVFDLQGELLALEGFITDITERRRIEEALRLSEEKYRRIVHAAQEGIWVLDAQARTSFVNPRMADLLGYGVEEMQGRPLFDFLGDKDKENVRRKLEQRRQGISERFEFRFTRRDGSELWTTISTNPIIDDRGNYVGALAMVTDITARKKETEARLELEDQLRQAQKMEAVGHLAGGVAHDFNNLLSPIIGYAEMGLSQLAGDHPLRRNLGRIMDTAERAKDLTMQLLAFGRKQILEMKLLKLNDEIRRFEAILRRLIREDVELQFKLDPSLGAVRADPTQVQQILINLAVNAQDAMPGGGKLIFETRNLLLEERHRRSRKHLKPGPYVQLHVRDNGGGIEPEVLGRIFEPFFTTKEIGKGTGLGLATVYGIVRQHLGDIQVSSSPGKGTSFKILLPRVEQNPDEKEMLPASTDDLRSRREEVVLLAEDEDEVREMVQEVLVTYGYKVIEAKDGEEALRRANAYAGEIHLLLTDLIMPRMNGYELFEHLRQARPGLRSLVMSGYTGDMLLPKGSKPLPLPLLEKPFAVRALLEKVRLALAVNPIAPPAELPARGSGS